jgi:hypothetical protein
MQLPHRNGTARSPSEAAIEGANAIKLLGEALAMKLAHELIGDGDARNLH